MTEGSPKKYRSYMDGARERKRSRLNRSWAKSRKIEKERSKRGAQERVKCVKLLRKGEDLIFRALYSVFLLFLKPFLFYCSSFHGMVRATPRWREEVIV